MTRTSTPASWPDRTQIRVVAKLPAKDLSYFAAVNPSVRPLAYIVAGVVIVASIIAGVRAWVLDRRSRRAASVDADHGSD